MFTGIVKELGKVKGLVRQGAVYRLTIECGDAVSRTEIGGSVAVNGVCLTLVEKNGRAASFDVMAETIHRTNLSALKVNDAVNLEYSLRADGSFDGHFVQGHIDCTGKIVRREESSGNILLEIEVPDGHNHLFVEKGSVTIDGISLTVGSVSRNRFSVYIIPHTLDITTLRTKKNGDEVNIEFDIIGKYIARTKERDHDSQVTDEFLRSKGF